MRTFRRSTGTSTRTCGRAGEIRTTDTGAVGTGLAHCRPEFIQEQARVIFGAIERDNALKGMDQATFTARPADHWGEITALHPFRDGNTRAQRAYFDQMSREADWSIDWQMINRDIRSFVDARVHAHATADSRPLRDVLAPTIRPAEAVISFPRSTDAFAHEPLPQPAPEVREDPGRGVRPEHRMTSRTNAVVSGDGYA